MITTITMIGTVARKHNLIRSRDFVHFTMSQKAIKHAIVPLDVRSSLWQLLFADFKNFFTVRLSSKFATEFCSISHHTFNVHVCYRYTMRGLEGATEIEGQDDDGRMWAKLAAAAAAAPSDDCCEVCLVEPRQGFALVPHEHARFCESWWHAGCLFCPTEISLKHKLQLPCLQSPILQQNRRLLSLRFFWIFL